jgi:hypothetical protein
MTARAEQLGFDYETDSEYAERMIPVLTPIALLLGALATDRKITVADVRRVAQDWHILTGFEQGRRLSFIHAVMPAAGFVPTDEFERSNIPRAHRNLNRVYRLPLLEFER